jgi:hypothetical protein
MSDNTEGKLIAVKAAVKEAVSKFNYMGINVGSYITDDEVTQVATAAIKASDDYDNAPSI